MCVRARARGNHTPFRVQTETALPKKQCFFLNEYYPIPDVGEAGGGGQVIGFRILFTRELVTRTTKNKRPSILSPPQNQKEKHNSSESAAKRSFLTYGGSTLCLTAASAAGPLVQVHAKPSRATEKKTLGKRRSIKPDGNVHPEAV